jgi:hypothetical protein
MLVVKMAEWLVEKMAEWLVEKTAALRVIQKVVA